ncbi:MAG: hypothetical protein K8F91_03430, partial [Candidatus Obscuribacterales bacterium]|nr:hypothetical protein [Candidatus Obscuribacterales bacterium]
MPEDENQYGDSGADQRPTHLTLTYKETIFNELDGLVTEGTLFDGLLIDMMQTGFSIQLDTIRKFVLYGKKLLKQHGIMLFVKSDGAIALTRDDPRGSLVINVFDSPYGALILHPAFASHACATVAGIDQVRLIDGGGTLANHILLSSIPVLTTKGKEAKSEFTLPASQNWLVQLIDDYSPVESILTSMQSRHRQLMQESLIILQELENARLIFPIFSRIQFLSNCYQSRKPFRLGHYMVAAGIISEPELKELLEQQQEEGWGDSQRNFLGILAVRADHINVRELQVLLADQYLYGGYHRLLEKT